MDEIDETVLNLQQRLKRAQVMRRNAPKIERAREVSKKRLATPTNIRKRAFMQARQIVRRKLAGQRGAEYEKLGPSEKMLIDRKLEGKQKLIKKIALRLIPRVKSAESKRLATFMHGSSMQNQGHPEGKSSTKIPTSTGPVQEDINTLFTEAFPQYDTSNALGQKVDNPVASTADKKMPAKGKSKNTEIIQYNKFQEELQNDTPAFSSLYKKSEKNGIDLEIIGEVYNRGWNTWSEDTGIDQQQFAFNRVNSYISQGKSYFNEDADLHKEEIKKRRPSNWKLARYSDDESEDSSLSYRLEKQAGKVGRPGSLSYKNWKKDLDEAVEVRHDRYLRSHGKKARGSGSFAFTHKQYGEPSKDEMHWVHHAGSFGDAAKSAKQWAKSKGHSSVYVMEENDLDEMSDKKLLDYIRKAGDDYFGNEKNKKKRGKGIDLAAHKLVKHARMAEEANLDELSLDTLGDYIDKASNSRRRAKGVALALKKGNAQAAKEAPRKLKPIKTDYERQMDDAHRHIYGESTLDESSEFKVGQTVYVTKENPKLQNTPTQGKIYHVGPNHVKLRTVGGTGLYRAHKDNISSDSKDSWIRTKHHREGLDEMRNVSSSKLKSIVGLGDREPEGMSPSFGRQIKATRAELIRRKKLGTYKEEVQQSNENFNDDEACTQCGNMKCDCKKPSSNSKARKRIEAVDRKPPHGEYTKQAEILKKIVDESHPNCGTPECCGQCDGANIDEGKDLNEAFNIAFASGVGVTLTAKDLGMVTKGGFEYHPSVIEQMASIEEVEEEVKSADKEPVVVPSHKDAYGNVIPAKTVMRKKNAKIIKSGNVHDGEGD